VREIQKRLIFKRLFPLHCRYEAGDHVAVYPSNDEVLVKRMGELLNVDLDEVISLVNVDGEI
jgi:sulfite reductase alpha subunit-like flavoprotein